MSDDPASPAAAEVEASQSKLDVIRLSYGEEEPEGEDYVQIEPHEAGGFQFSGVVGIHAADVEPGSRTSTSGAIGSDGPFPTAEAAEAAAIEWAAEQGAETLYVLTPHGTGIGDCPTATFGLGECIDGGDQNG